MKITFVLCTAILAWLVVPAGAQQAVSASAFQKAVKDKRVSLTCADGTSGSGRYTMPGNAGLIKGTYVRPGAAAVSDVGQVRAQGNSVCLRFRMLNGGNEKCFDVSQTATRRFQFSTSGFNACNVIVL